MNFSISFHGADKHAKQCFSGEGEQRIEIASLAIHCLVGGNEGEQEQDTDTESPKVE